MILKPVDGNDYSHKHVLTVEDIKDILEIGQNKAYELVNGDYFPTMKFGRKHIIPKEPFFEWLNSSHDDNKQ